MRRAGIAIAVTIVASGCGWMQLGFDAGRSAANSAESTITAANVARLVHRAIPDGIVTITLGDRLVGISATGTLQAFDATTCPTPASAACTPAWTSATPGGVAASDGSTIFSVGNANDTNTLYATGLDGTPKWSVDFPYLPATENPGVSQVVVSGGYVLVGLRTYAHGTNRWATVVEVVPAGGCGAPTCQALHEIPVLGTADFVASGTTMLALAEGEGADFAARVRAFDVKFAEELWRSKWFDDSSDPLFSPAHGRLVARNGVVSFHQYETNRTDEYAIDGSPCNVPAPCPRVRNLIGTGDPGAISDHTIVTEGSRLAWYDANGSGCSGIPVRCAWFAVTPTGAPGSIAVLGIAGGVVYAVRDRHVLVAYDETAATGCSGPPTVCTPLWTYDLGANQTVVNFLQWNGRVYVTAAGPAGFAQHVFLLPSS